MVSDHQRNAASFPGCIERSLNLFTQALLLVAPRKKMLFMFMGPILENLFLRTNSLESERLAVMDRSITVYMVATVHAKILVSVHGFNMQVSPVPAVFQVDTVVVSKNVPFCADQVAVNFMVGW